MIRTIGIYGGFFNPFHLGHLHVIQSSLQHLRLQKLIALPTFHNPLKENINSLNPYDQIKQLRSEINLPRVKVSDFEFRHQTQCTSDVLKKITNDGLLKGKTFMFTGKLLNISRSEAKNLIEKNSGSLVSNVSKKLDFLIIGEKPTKRKVESAKELKIKIITQSEWMKMLNLTS